MTAKTTLTATAKVKKSKSKKDHIATLATEAADLIAAGPQIQEAMAEDAAEDLADWAEQFQEDNVDIEE